MNTHWKIFNIVNLTCISLVTSLFIWPILRDSDLSASTNRFFYIVGLSILLVVTANCLHNISLTRLLTVERNLTLTRKIFFWILCILFSAVILVFAYQTPDAFLHYYLFRETPHTSYLRPAIHILSISITGLYTMAMQIILFYRIRKYYRQGIKDTIDGMGS